MGYAQNDSEFKLLIQDNIPGSKDVFDAIDSLLREDVQPLPKTVDISVPPSKLKVQMAAFPMPDIKKPPEIIDKPTEITEKPTESIEKLLEMIEEKPEVT